MRKSYPIRSKGKPQPNYKEVDSEESTSEESTTPKSEDSQIITIKKGDKSENIQTELTFESVDSEDLSLASDNEEDTSPIRFQNLMQSIPIYDGSQNKVCGISWIV